MKEPWISPVGGKEEDIRKPKLEPCREKISTTPSPLYSVPILFTGISITRMWKFLYIHRICLFKWNMFICWISAPWENERIMWRRIECLCIEGTGAVCLWYHVPSAILDTAERRRITDFSILNAFKLLLLRLKWLVHNICFALSKYSGFRLIVTRRD